MSIVKESFKNTNRVFTFENVLKSNCSTITLKVVEELVETTFSKGVYVETKTA